MLLQDLSKVKEVMLMYGQMDHGSLSLSLLRRQTIFINKANSDDINSSDLGDEVIKHVKLTIEDESSRCLHGKTENNNGRFNSMKWEGLNVCIKPLIIERTSATNASVSPRLPVSRRSMLTDGGWEPSLT